MTNGICIHSSVHTPGNVSDIPPFRRNISWHQIVTENSIDGSYEMDMGELETEYPHHWAVLMDKGYQGTAQSVWAVMTKKKIIRALFMS